MSLQRGASAKRRATKRRANGAHVINQPGIPLHQLEIQPGMIPAENPANLLEPAWLGRQGPLVYKTSHFSSEIGENPKEVTNMFSKSGIKKIRINSVQFCVSFYKLRTDQILGYTIINTAQGQQDLSITIPKGNYSLRELQAYMKRELHRGRIQLAVNQANQSILYVRPEFSIVNDVEVEEDQFTSFIVNFTQCQDLKDALGFRTHPDVFVGGVSQIIERDNGTGTVGCTAVSTGHINLALPNAIHLCAPNIHNLMRSRSVDMSTDQLDSSAFIVSIPIRVNSGQFVSWQNTNGEFYDCYGTGDFLHGQLAFCYSNGEKVDFNGMPWSVELGYLNDDQGPQARDIS